MTARKALVSGAVRTLERWKVGILVFDGVAALDLAGPFEVLTRARLEPGVDFGRAVADETAHYIEYRRG